MTKIIAGFVFLAISVIGGIQYMKANPTKAQTSYLIEGILIGFFVGMMISIVIDWQWIGIGAGFGQFIGGSLVHKFQNKKRGNKKWYLIIKRNLNHFINLKKPPR